MKQFEAHLAVAQFKFCSLVERRALEWRKVMARIGTLHPVFGDLYSMVYLNTEYLKHSVRLNVIEQCRLYVCTPIFAAYSE